jgi:hypothetical protein
LGTFRTAAEGEVGFETTGTSPVGPLGPVADHRKFVGGTPVDGPMLVVPLRAMPVENSGEPENVSVLLAVTTAFAATPPGCIPARTQL